LHLGASHLAEGPDHLLFVAGLLLLAGGLGRTLASLTAFTLGHSVTLSLSALGLLGLSPRWAELGIALSVTLLALSILLRRERVARGVDGSTWKAVYGFSVASGLLHGLGFASALSEAGLPSGARALCLFGFNLGIELGQVGWVLVLLVATGLGRRALSRFSWDGEQTRLRAQALTAYGIGGVGVMWCIERALLLASP